MHDTPRRPDPRLDRQIMEAASRAPLEPLSDDGLDMPSAPTPSARKADGLPALEPLEPLKDELLDPAAAILGLSDDLALPLLDDSHRETVPDVSAPAPETPAHELLAPELSLLPLDELAELPSLKPATPP